jgi:hypothetical protein
MSGSAVEAAEQYRKASAMGYQPAQDQLAAINVRQAKEQDAAVAIAAFPNVPVQAV